MKIILLALTLFAAALGHAQCVANFTVSTTNDPTIDFTSTSTGAVNPRYMWDLGVGSYSQLANPSITYPYNGTYTVSLQYSDTLNATCTSTFTNTVTITNGGNPPCNAFFNFLIDSATTGQVYFYDMSSYRPSTWHWDFGDGQTSNQQQITHQYAIPAATYSVCLTITNFSGDTCTFCDTLMPVHCSQRLSTSFTHSNNSPVTFTSNCSGAGTPSYFWNFGDGNTSTLPNPVHAYQYNGIYQVSLTYKDSLACQEIVYDSVVITNTIDPPCDIHFNSHSDTVAQNMNVITFYGSSPQSISQWIWDFGDGQTSNQSSATHTYTAVGTYYVCLSGVRSLFGDTCTTCDSLGIAMPSLLKGSVFSDANSNCVKDGSDAGLDGWVVVAQETSTLHTIYGSTDAAGNFTIVAHTGNYNVSLITKTYWNKVCPANPYPVTVSSRDTVTNLNFGAQVASYCRDLIVSTGAANMRRCMMHNYSVKYGNNGTIPATGVMVKLTFDPRVIPVSASVPWDSASGTSRFWKVGTVNPGQFSSFYIIDSITCAAALADKIPLYSQILPTAGDCNAENNSMEEITEVRGSFDPNEKRVYSSTNKVAHLTGAIRPTDTLNFTVGFQNTGNDTAFKVVVYDTLDAQHLDVASVISGASSHAYTMDVLGNGVLRWTFKNILLVDSTTNEPDSHGFVKFRIRQKPNNPHGYVISNSAGIVFDFNEPVITDTVLLTVDYFIGIAEAGKQNGIQIDISPNPGSGHFVLKSDQRINSVEVMNVLGEVIFRQAETPDGITMHDGGLEFDLTLCLEGIYLVRVQTENGLATRKVIVLR